MIVTRFAPSPTGRLHVGNLRTALLNWLFARKAGGDFILRLDDTDAQRSRPEFAEAIRADLRWLGLGWDREARQSDRLERYAEAATWLREAGRLYEAFDTPEELALRRRAQRAAGRPPVYDRAALRLSEAERQELRAERAPHWRFLLEPGRIEWRDGVLGPVSIDAGSLSDPVLFRADGQVLYTLASVVDDLEMGVTDVVRGADHVTNTGAQLQIIAALDGAPPRFAHHSLLTGPDGTALSKRLGALSLDELRAGGLESMGLVSFMARLGASDPVEPRADMAEVIAGFDLGRFGASPTRFDPAELRAQSVRVLRGLGAEAIDADLAALGVPPDAREPFWEAVRDNIDARADLADWWTLCRDGATPVVAPEDAGFVATAMELLPPRPWDGRTWRTWTCAVRAETGRSGRALFLPLRRALTGLDHGPDMGRLMPLLEAAPRARTV